MQRTIPITQNIESIIQDIPGWTPADQLLALYTLALSTASLGGDVLEVGSWCGRSTVAIALAVQKSQVGKVQSIDLFPQKNDWYQNSDGSWSFSVEGTQAYSIQTVWNDPFKKDIAPLYEKQSGVLDIFSESLKNYGVAEYVAYHKGTTKTFAQQCKVCMQSIPNYRLAFIDGDHCEEAVAADIAFALEHIVPNGILCFDDAFTTYKGVSSAIENILFSSPRYLYSQQITRKFHAVFLQ